MPPPPPTCAGGLQLMYLICVGTCLGGLGDPPQALAFAPPPEIFSPPCMLRWPPELAGFFAWPTEASLPPWYPISQPSIQPPPPLSAKGICQQAKKPEGDQAQHVPEAGME
eukprot:EG_transcript_50200